MGYLSYFKCFKGLTSSRGLTVSLEPQQQSQLTEVGQLLCSQILSKTLKIGHREKNKHKLDLNPRYGPDPCMYPFIHTDRETDRQLSLGHFSLKVEFHKFWFLAKKNFHIFVVVAGVYSSTNWPPFTGGQNSILNWVLKLKPLSLKVKK